MHDLTHVFYFTIAVHSCNNSLVSLCFSFSVSKMPNRSIRHSVGNRPIRIALISRSSAPMVASVRPIIAVSRDGDSHCTGQNTLRITGRHIERGKGRERKKMTAEKRQLRLAYKHTKGCCTTRRLWH